MSIITLQDAKSWLRYPNPSQASNDDASIQNVIDAAEQFIENKVGICTPKVYDEFYDGGTCKLWLRHTPVLQILDVRESWGVVGFDLDFQQPDTGPTITDGTDDNAKPAANLWAYSLDVPSIGEVTRRGPMNVSLPFAPGDRSVRVMYRAGRNPIPPAIQLAARELVAHVWSNSELRAVASSAAYTAYDASVDPNAERPDTSQALWVGVPMRVLTWLEAVEDPALPHMA